MTTDLLPDPATAFGERVRQRLHDEQVAWFTTVGADGTPQPNPVWFLWHESSLLVYNRPDANRLTHLAHRPRVSLHLDGNRRGGDVVVLTGSAQILNGHPLPHEVPDYLGKYRESMIRVSGSPEAFSEAYPVPVLVEITRVRGF
jgi:PPOX class probable F420-dependent enzyme